MAAKMQLFIPFFLSILILLGIADAGWREDCNFGGNGQFHIIHEKPYLSTMCPDHNERQICTMLDLSHCIMNSHGHLIPTINGHFERSCENCHLTGDNGTILACACRMFGKPPAALQYTEIETDNLVENRDGLLGCFDSPPEVCPGFDLSAPPEY
ncbi:Cyanovirin-N [Nemania sp. NC0429]|nr:Cyanovirin-N [Nemania sp. NC0429]